MTQNYGIENIDFLFPLSEEPPYVPVWDDPETSKFEIDIQASTSFFSLSSSALVGEKPDWFVWIEENVEPESTDTGEDEGFTYETATYVLTSVNTLRSDSGHIPNGPWDLPGTITVYVENSYETGSPSIENLTLIIALTFDDDLSSTYEFPGDDDTPPSSMHTSWYDEDASIVAENEQFKVTYTNSDPSADEEPPVTHDPDFVAYGGTEKLDMFDYPVQLRVSPDNENAVQWEAGLSSTTEDPPEDIQNIVGATSNSYYFESNDLPEGIEGTWTTGGGATDFLWLRQKATNAAGTTTSDWAIAGYEV